MELLQLKPVVESCVILDTEQAFSVLREVGPEALSVYFVIESDCLVQHTLDELAELCNMDRATVEKARFKLGISNPGLKE